MEKSNFEENLINLQDSLTRFASKLIISGVDVEDLVQDTFLKALQHRDQFDDNGNFRAWTFTIMRNTFINNYRKKLKRVATFDYSIDKQNIKSLQTYIGTDTTYSHTEIASSMRRLEPEYRIPFQMYTLGYKYEEIAKAMNIKVGTVKSRIHCCRQKLMRDLNEYRPYFGTARAFQYDSRCQSVSSH